MSIFATKPIDQITAEAGAEGAHTLKRVLGPLDLTLLGIGAIIGAGIFVLTGQAAAAQRRPGHRALLRCSPALACALRRPLLRRVRLERCPIAGCAYTYGYATLGEFVAWIIGWDLMLEYAVRRRHRRRSAGRATS